MERDLAALAADINKDLETAKTAEGLARDARLQAALGLAEAQRQCNAQGIAFYPWCLENIRYAAGTIEELVKIGKSEDPVEAIRLNRMRHVISTARHNQKVKRTIKAIGTLDGVKKAFLNLAPADRAEFLAWALRQDGAAPDPLKIPGLAAIAKKAEPSIIAPPDRARLMAGR